ncbi:hypothetical protein IMZ48_27100 [Candidatus Bathyarchaeota archaeon]|nr:hypothetical protein [Candidatus Bathyarchaeota archaeon]
MIGGGQGWNGPKTCVSGSVCKVTKQVASLTARDLLVWL